MNGRMLLTAWAAILLTCGAEASDTLRIDDLAPYGRGDTAGFQKWCAQVRGVNQAPPAVVVDGVTLPISRVKQQRDSLCFNLAEGVNSGPVWLSAGGFTSNAVWLSTRQSWVQSPSQDRLVIINDRVVTALDLISLILRDDTNGLLETRRIALQYDVDIVGVIPPLNVVQVRLRARTLAARHSIVSSMKSDPAVQGIVVEDDNPERPEDPERIIEPPDQAGWIANKLEQAVEAFKHNVREQGRSFQPTNVVVGVVEKGVNFESTDFSAFAAPCKGVGTCLYARHSSAINGHGSVVAGILAARLYPRGNVAFLSRLGAVGGRFDIIVDRGAASGVTARIAASVNLVEDGARVLNWSWGVHRIGTLNLRGEPVDINVRTDEAMAGYELLLRRFFDWLEHRHSSVVVVNSAGNSASTTDDHLPASLSSAQLVVVGGHQRSRQVVDVADPRFAVPRSSSNVGPRIDISAAACPNPSRSTAVRAGRGGGCGTSYAAALVTGVVAAMISINPDLTPRQIKHLLRESALPMIARPDQARRIGPTRPIRAAACSNNVACAVEQFARLDMHQALALAVKTKRHPSMAEDGGGELLE